MSKLDFPPYSPDLNPIETLWATMARAVGSTLSDLFLGVDSERTQAMARISGALTKLSEDDQKSILDLVQVALGASAEERP